MSVRIWKIVFTAIFSLLVFAYAVQNVANISGGMYSSFVYVLSQADHVAYPESVVPAITNPALIWATLSAVLVLEFASAALTAFGAWQMWQHRKSNAGEFASAKRHALNGFGVAVVVWLLFFGTFGAAVFQMWQTTLGAGSFNGAFQYTVYALLLFALVGSEERQTA
jgi:predicted small integral membrane protein